MNIQTTPQLQHLMHVMDPTGHTTVTWNPEDAASVRAARTEFNRLRCEGYSCFRMNVILENGVLVEEKGDRLDTFDQTVGRLMMVPQLVGG